MNLTPQAPNAVVMIRPHYFSPNEETRKDNSFQSDAPGESSQLAEDAYKQVTQAAETLRQHGVTVHLFEDKSTATPDSVFPNNWFSTHPGGQIGIYPMYARNRRDERRQDIIEFLKRQYRVRNVIDYSGFEYDNQFLEGTGAMVLDHVERVAYAARSNRMHTPVLSHFCNHFSYEPLIFDAETQQGVAVYHTNVLMCIGSDYVLIGLDMIKDEAQRSMIVQRFENMGKTVILLSENQINAFCGNALELAGGEKRLLALSQTAYQALTHEQVGLLEKKLRLLPLDVTTIEMAGGSVRCMLAGVHLSKR